MRPETFLMIFALLIVILLIINKTIKKKKAKKEFLAKKQAEKQKNEISISNFSKNQQVINWAIEISAHIYTIIQNNINKEYEFHLRAYRNDLVFGVYLRTVVYKGLNSYKEERHRTEILSYNFKEYNLPEIKKNELSCLEIAVSNLVKDILQKENIKITTQKSALFIDSITKHRVEDTDNDNIISLIYIPPKATGSW